MEEEDTEANQDGRLDRRLKKLAKERRDGLARIKELENQLADQDAKAQSVDKLATTLTEMEARMAQQESDWSTRLTQQQADHELDRAIMSRGIVESEGIQVARMLYSQIEGDDKPPVEEWLASDALPRAVSVYIPAAPSPTAPGAPPPAPPTQPPPPTSEVTANRGAQPTTTYQAPADVRSAAANPEYWRANRAKFVTEDGYLKKPG